MSGEPTEREHLEGLRYEDKFPDVDALVAERDALAAKVEALEQARDEAQSEAAYWIAENDHLRLELAAASRETDTLALAARQLLGALRDMTTDGEPARFSANVEICMARLAAAVPAEEGAAEDEESWHEIDRALWQAEEGAEG